MTDQPIDAEPDDTSEPASDPAPPTPDSGSGAGTAEEAAFEQDMADAVHAAEELTAAAAMSPEEVVALKRERDDFLDTMRRLQADFDNYRKRSLRDHEAAADRGGERLVAKLLPVLDTFDLALTHEEDPDNSALAKLHQSLLAALTSEGLDRIAPTGETFDPERAEAVMHDPGDGIESAPTVSEVLRAGYAWKGRVVRAAMVKVIG